MAESSKKSAKRRKIDRERKREARERETEEEREERLRDDRNRKASRREEEDEEERQERLGDQRLRQASRRQEEDEEERQERLGDQRLRQASRRQEEDEEERQERLGDQRLRQASRRQEEDEEERQERLGDQRLRQASRRQEEDEEERQERLGDQRLRQASRRQEEDEEERQERLGDKRIREATRRQEEDEEDREERLQDDRIRKATRREEEDEEEREERHFNNRNREQNRRRTRRENAKNIGRKALEVIGGTQVVEECDILPLFDEDGEPNGRVCEKCNAVLWPKEPKDICCCSGGVELQPLFDIRNRDLTWFKELCLSGTVEGNIYRKYARNINNGISLASLKVQRVFPRDGGWVPAVIIQGKVAIQIGPLIRTDNSAPVFSQLYVLDEDEANQELDFRFGTMLLPETVTEPEKEQLIRLLNNLQEKMREVNPYVKDYMSAAQIIRERAETEDTREVRLIVDADKRPDGEHQRRFNTDFHEITVLFDDENPGWRDIVLVNKEEGNYIQMVKDTHRAADALRFTLMFPAGDDGWHLYMKRSNGRNLTGRMFYSYHLMMRYPKTENFSPVLHSGKLTQEYMCVNAAKIENQELFFIKKNQKKLRAETYNKLTEQISAHDVEVEKRLQQAMREGRELSSEEQALGKIGLPVILPASHTGSPRYMHKHYQDAMAIVREYGKPDLFITFTCNSKWREITESIEPGETANNRPDVVVRVFREKLRCFMNDLTKSNVLGKTKAHVSVIEFQKRGLPHAHILLIFDKESKIERPEDVDTMIVAEFPVPEECEEGPERDRAQQLLDLVKTHMVHTCSPRCRPEGYNQEKCQKHFPQDYCEQTMWDKDGYYPFYRRRKDEKFCNEMPNTKVVDNRNIIPYSPWLLMKYKAHINVEVCVSVRSVKYLYKYIHKGPDRMMCLPKLDDGYRLNEVEKYQDMRSIGSSEACWNIFSFPITDRDPAVIALRIHLENEQTILIDEESEENIRAQAEVPKETELTGFFKYNASDRETNQKYCDFPKDHVWNRSDEVWHKRKKQRVIGRVHTVHPTSGDVFYLRLLLHHDHCKGKVSYTDLRTVNGVVYESYRAACEELGLLQNDGEWHSTLQEAAQTSMPSEIRNLFVIILTNCKPSDPENLFQKHYTDWIDDVKKKYPAATEEQLRIMILLKIEKKLQLLSKELKDFNLPVPTDVERLDIEELIKKRVQTKDSIIRQEELDFDVEGLKEESRERYQRLNQKQKQIYDEILRDINLGRGGAYFIDARGGTGKTFLLNTILAAVRTLEDEKNIAVAVAYSGIAATLLSLGRTFHSRFKVPVNFTDETVTFRIRGNDCVGKVIKDAKVIVWDEGPMSHRYLLEALDRTLQDVMENDKIFGGKILIISGDFRQVLPVIKKASRAQITSAALNKSKLWKHFKIRQLTENMRIGNNPELRDFDNWLGFLGEGSLIADREPDWIRIKDQFDGNVMEIDDTDEKSVDRSLHQFIETVFPDLGSLIDCPGWTSWISERAILAPRNKDVDMINAEIISDFPGEETILTSADATINEDEQTAFPVEFLNAQTPAGLPPHKLILKAGMVLILLRNLNPRNGLCNGTRLILRKVSRLLLECSLVCDRKKKNPDEEKESIVLIPRIELICDKGDYPIEWKRRQFPVRPAFAMTINKAQGQTFRQVGIWLREPCFGHGQLYVACSRVGNPEHLHIAVNRSDDEMTRNVVYQEALLDQE